MHAPQSAVDGLARLHPRARLAWYGPTRKFALCELYSNAEARRIMYLPWERAAGPVFGKAVDPEVDTLFWLANFTPQEVFSGAFLEKIRSWRTPLSKRVRESATAAGRAYDDKIKDLAGEMGGYLWRRAQWSNNAGHILPDKFLTLSDKNAEERAARQGEGIVRSFERDAQVLGL